MAINWHKLTDISTFAAEGCASETAEAPPREICASDADAALHDVQPLDVTGDWTPLPRQTQAGHVAVARHWRYLLGADSSDTDGTQH